MTPMSRAAAASKLAMTFLHNRDSLKSRGTLSTWRRLQAAQGDSNFNHSTAFRHRRGSPSD